VETVDLLRSPGNAEHLLAAMQESQVREIKPQSIADLQRELGIGQEAEKAS
jgi:PHD/YefM family antitoxin component YafN of YafNO toxin-antitoxin module